MKYADFNQYVYYDGKSTVCKAYRFSGSQVSLPIQLYSIICSVFLQIFALSHPLPTPPTLKFTPFALLTTYIPLSPSFPTGFTAHLKYSTNNDTPSLESYRALSRAVHCSLRSSGWAHVDARGVK